ncbi:haloacid dehalogenase type II [Streptomyces spinoverrucosus]|uniref:haloacid dehalogenase type II n=1 Tax=Streptomyces spinoverrucosus TaxID=284043 RepID=UPI0018C4125A|nr:haloacid dehalogenase type II [Streptomyces spinoverrucosus]MBG0851295.1 haloacid dehalogenase type II [Streptomyces spinoverrucosus]
MPADGHHVIVFDVNETLSDLTPLRLRFEDIGAPGHLMPTWFAGVLRDGFALTIAGAYADFAAVGRDGVRAVLSGVEGWTGDVDAAAQHVLDGFAHLDVHPDVPDGVRQLSAAGYRLVAMTNGSAALTERLLSRAGLLDRFAAVLDVGGPRCWKPAPAAYRYAVDRAGVQPDQALMVAVHPWDIDGARRAGLGGAWLRRGVPAYPRTMSAPTHIAQDLRELADALVTPRT